MDLGHLAANPAFACSTNTYMPTVWPAQSKISAFIELTFLQGEADNVINYIQ